MYLQISYSPGSLAPFFFSNPSSTMGVAFNKNFRFKIYSQTVLLLSNAKNTSMGSECSVLLEKTLANTEQQCENLPVPVPRSVPCTRHTQQPSGCPASRSIHTTTFLEFLICRIKMDFAVLLEHHQHYHRRVSRLRFFIPSALTTRCKSIPRIMSADSPPDGFKSRRSILCSITCRIKCKAAAEKLLLDFFLTP